MSILITAPLDSESGYGHKSREIVKPIAEKYWDDINIGFLPWGNTPTSGLDNDKYEFLKEKKVQLKLQERPDLHIHIGIPTEMKPQGKKNIIFTSGAEASMISHQWILFINKHIDLVVVPSNFVRNIMMNTTYEDASGKEFKIEVPIQLVPESYSDKLFSGMNEQEEDDLNELLSGIKEKEWFVTYGQVNRMMETGSERKNVTRLIKDFIEEFRGNNGVALLLKCNPSNFSNLAYYMTESYIDRIIDETGYDRDDIPSIYLIEGYLSHPQLFALMSHDNVISHVTTTHGEGFGRFLLEASLSEKPIIIPKVGSFRDFLYGNSIEYMEIDWVEIPKEALFRDTIISSAKWTEPKKGEVRRALQKVYKNYKKMDGSKLAKENKETYHISNIESEVLKIVDKYYSRKVNVIIPEIPE